MQFITPNTAAPLLMRFALAGACMSAVATGVAYLARPPEKPSEWFRIAEPIQDLGPVSLGEHTVVIRIENHSPRPQRVVGVGHGCVVGACYRPNFDEPIEIDPAASADIECKVFVSQPASFEASMTIYFAVEDNIRPSAVTIRGVGINPEAVANAFPIKP